MKKTLLCWALLCVLASLLALAPIAPAEGSAWLTSPESIVWIEPPAEPIYRKHRSRKREDYPYLTDEGFANFRCVATTGMGRHALYRSSSPVDPAIHRNRYADHAVGVAGIRTVLNLSDKRSEMERYEGYDDTCYSRLDILPLNMSQNRLGKRFGKKLARGFRFIISHEGPYLIHCVLGRDRTGFACAVLECLMGASADEVIDDYMLSYYNFYGIMPGLEEYDSNLKGFTAELATAFDIGTIYSSSVDLSRCASDYLLGLGLSEAEIAVLKQRLGTDYP